VGSIVETTTVALEPELGDRFALQGARVDGTLEDVVELRFGSAEGYEVDRAYLRMALDILERRDTL
jgi:hypothetical protein